MNPNTKTGRAQLARRARRNGHFDHPARPGQPRRLEVLCPLCLQMASTAWESGKTTIALLDAAMDNHLLHDCTKGPQQ
ncbi:hypothetical protein [Streptosporangium lutulentum]|uniref:Uncharacterized protein n=1 Tax=Streptosporangium lutulentum TaxID=1461250 RepID=A0ABT9QAN3_9ACTN|nr:hypothetical protein [Streptosporangium lutulentum]MDP9843348.1 hypothetical protein [Streptosporangium lutulentum]